MCRQVWCRTTFNHLFLQQTLRYSGDGLFSIVATEVLVRIVVPFAGYDIYNVQLHENNNVGGFIVQYNEIGSDVFVKLPPSAEGEVIRCVCVLNDVNGVFNYTL